MLKPIADVAFGNGISRIVNGRSDGCIGGGEESKCLSVIIH